MQSREQYEEMYHEEVKQLSNQQIISLLIMNVRNQTEKQKKYKKRKDKVQYLQNLISHIDILGQELMVRMDEGKEVGYIAKQVDDYLSRFDEPKVELTMKRGFYEVKDDEKFIKTVDNDTATLEIKVNGGAKYEEEHK